MKRLVILAALAMPIAAYAQSSPTAEDELAAAKSMVNELMNVVTAQRAQINADLRERGELLKRAGEAEKKTPQPAPTAPTPAPKQ